MQIRHRPTAVATRCPYCHEERDDLELTVCAGCCTPHHLECLGELGRCTVLGCETPAGVFPGEGEGQTLSRLKRNYVRHARRTQVWDDEPISVRPSTGRPLRIQRSARASRDRRRRVLETALAFVALFVALGVLAGILF